MDKKLPQNLDPKLKEAYDRIMSTSFSREIIPPPQPLPVVPAQIPTPSTSSGSTTPPKPKLAPPTPIVKTEKHNSLIIAIVLGIIFLIVYGLFWVKLFGVKI